MASESVKVVVRCRPLNQREKDLNCKVIAKIDSFCGHVGLTNPADQSGTSKSFTFDAAYFIDSSTEQIYNEICFPIVEALTEGYNGTVFAYGQTGCGKSFTMQGTSDPVHRGIIPRAFEHIFEAVSTSENYKFLVQASFLEIYNEEIRDLLGGDIKKKLELKESPDTGVSVGGLSKHIVHDVKSCERIMQEGWKNRSVGATLMNADSSRSHSIFTIYLERIGLDDLESNDIKYGKLNLVDLAGSERQAKTGATGDRLREATKINLSLSALGNVISALVDGKSTHIPYRDSKLTRLLQDSLGGNTKTLMVACISPADNNYDETLSTLRYANRAKNIQNKPKVNEDPKDAMLREYREEILRLKQLIEISGGSGGGNSTAKTAGNVDTDSRDIEQMKRTYDTQMQDLARKYEEEVKHKEKLKEDMDRLKSLMENNDQPKSNSLKESMRKLQAIEKGMIGGEKAGDIELKERRARKKKVAETKMNAISEALSQLRAEDDDNLLLKAYGDITEELRAKAQLLKKAKRKIQSLEQEVLDLHSEFECERTDYLETIRRQEEQLRLMTQLFDTIAPLMRTECNFSSLDKIKANSYWDDNRRQWVLPQITWNHIKLPATGPNGYNGSPSPSQRYHPDSPTSVFDSDLIDHQGSGVTISQQRPDRLLMKLENSENEALATKYFLPKRKEQLLDNLHKFKMSVKSVENGGQHQPQQQQQQRAPMNGVAPESGFSLDARNMINTISTRLVDRSSRFNEHFKHSSVPPTHSSPNPLLQNIVTNLSIPHSSSQSAESPRNLLPLQRS